MGKVKLYIRLILINIPVVWRNFKYALDQLYWTLKLDYWALIFFHRYHAKSFNPLHLKHNVRILMSKERTEWLKSTHDGRLERVRGKGEKAWLSIQNMLLFGALTCRLKRVVYLNLMTLTLEFRNPFDRKILCIYLERKMALIRRILERIQTINGSLFDQSRVETNIDIFLRNSLIQERIIEQMHRAVRRQREPKIVQKGKEGLAKGLFPVLIEMGRSGSYWIRAPDSEVLGLFKPFDEECYAPNNPAGAANRGAMGQRRMRRGTKVGEAAHNEVAAFLIDAFFGFGIVPRTYYASFTHHAFFQVSDTKRLMMGKKKKKYGSFQEYIDGFVPIAQLDESEIPLIPLDEFQILVVLDVIAGNSDRHLSNLLIGDQKIAAIDHGYTFPDVVTPVMTDVWHYLEIGKERFHPALKRLIASFPFDEVAWKLRRRCFRSLNAIERMRERIALLHAAMDADLSPQEMIPLWEMEYLLELAELNERLDAAAHAVVARFCTQKCS